MVFDSLTSSNEEQQHVLLIVDINRICRFCLRSNGALTSIFEDCDKSLIEQLNDFVNIEVTSDASQPGKICHRCRYMIEMCHEFKTMVLQSSKTLSANVYDDSLEFIEKAMVKKETNESQINSKLHESLNVKKDDDVVNVSKHKIKRRTIVKSSKVMCKNVKKLIKSDTFSPIPKLSSLYVTSKNKECLLCLDKFTDNVTLENHIDDHVRGTSLEPYYRLGEKDLTCKHCGKLFGYRFNFLVHQREYLKLKPFTCLHAGCDVGFHSKPALRQHSLIHGERNFICSVCAVGFKRKSDLKGHEIIHEDAGLKYECPVCGFMCKNRLTKAAHLRKHQRRPMYKCESCSKEYFSPSELERHEFIHLPEKRFRCNHCPYAYYSRSALCRHEKIHHLNDRKVENSNQVIIKDVDTTSYTCNLCGEIHPQSPTKLDQSLIPEVPYRCSHCNTSYLEKVCFDAHKLNKCDLYFKIQYSDVFDADSNILRINV